MSSKRADIKEKVLGAINDLDPEKRDAEYRLLFQVGKHRSFPYVVFMFAKNHSELAQAYKNQLGNPVIFGVVYGDDYAELYVIIKRVGESRWREFDI